MPCGSMRRRRRRRPARTAAIVPHPPARRHGPWGTGGTCLISSLTPDVIDDQVRSADLPHDLTPLEHIKRQIDLTNIFRITTPLSLPGAEQDRPESTCRPRSTHQLSVQSSSQLTIGDRTGLVAS